jgi:Tfp pilus assembly protein PilO
MNDQLQKAIELVKTKAISIPIAVILVLTIIFWLFLWPSVTGSISKDQNLEAQNASQIAALENQLAREKSLAATSASISQKLLSFENAVPDNVDWTSLVSQVNTLAASANVDLRSLTPGTLTPVSISSPSSTTTSPSSSASSSASSLESINVQILVSGSVTALYTFMSDIYNPADLPRLLTISSYQYSPGSGGAPASLNLTTSAYFSSISTPISGT